MKNMNVLITGATSGIGEEFAKLLSPKGYNLILASRNLEKMKFLANELSSSSQRIECIEIDLSIENSAQKLYNIIQEKGLKIDILINNSGYGLFGTFANQDINKLEKMIILNSATVTSLCRFFSQDMIKNRNGYILNIASTAAFQPIPYFAAYSASKSYIVNFSKAIHYELKKFGVSVTCLCPGPTETNFFETAMAGKRFELFVGKPMMKANIVARIGINAMFRKRKIVVSGLSNKIFTKILPLIPLSIVEFVLKRYVKN